MVSLPLVGGMFLGWSLGANDSANVFGTAVASRIVSFRQASILCGTAIILGALLQGQAGVDRYAELVGSYQTVEPLVVISVAAAVTVTIMTVLRLPVSTSQAVVGAIAGVALATDTVDWGGFKTIVICWLATPVGAMVIACLVYYLLSMLINNIPMSMLTRDKLLWGGLILVGAYGAYALGANNVANATGIFAGTPGVTNQDLALLGGIAISVGSITYSKRVMMAVGAGIMPLDAFTALVAVASMALVVHVFAVIGVPVSTSQGIVGAIMGIGLIRGVTAIRFKVLRNIGIGWLMTPALSLILAAAGYAIICR